MMPWSSAQNSTNNKLKSRSSDTDLSTIVATASAKAITNGVSAAGITSIRTPSPQSPQITSTSTALKPFEMRNNYQLKHKTSAEIISETKSMLASGARLVTTRRPITPREPRRQLYGKVSLAGRPPSAFSLRYLQFESRVLPSIESIARLPKPNSKENTKTTPISTSGDSSGSTTTTRNDTLNEAIASNVVLHSATSALRGSSSLGALNTCNASTIIFDEFNAGIYDKGTISTATAAKTSNTVDNNGSMTVVAVAAKSTRSNSQAKLPSLLVAPKITASLDNLCESMPPRKDFNSSTKTDNNNGSSSTMTTISGADSANVNVSSSSIGISSDIGVNNSSSSSSAAAIVTTATAMATKSKTMMSKDILAADEKITLPMIDSAKQSTVKKQPITAQQRQLLLRCNDLLAQSTTETLLDMLKSHAGIKECSDETILHINGILTELYTRVKGARGDWRSSVLGSLYGLVECKSAKILLAVARVVLVLGVTGSNLTGACKLVFKVARNERNDSLFVNSDVPELLIDGLGRASPIEDPEACIYGYGAVRFLANAIVSSSLPSPNSGTEASQDSRPLTTSLTVRKNKTLARRLAQHGAISLMILHLQMINEAGSTATLSGPPLHALYQLSGALRALSKIPLAELQSTTNVTNSSRANDTSTPYPMSVYNNEHCSATECNRNRNDNAYPSIHESVEELDIHMELAGPHLIRAAEICVDEIEVQSNIIRTLSILSDQEKCCDAIVDLSPRLGILLGPISYQQHGMSVDKTNQKKKSITEKSLGVLNRIGYILGNIMARSDAARIEFYNNDVAMEYLLKNLEVYATDRFSLKQKKRACSGDETNSGNANSDTDTVIDVVIKLIRVIANMSVNAEVGYGLANCQALGSVLLTLLLTINKLKLNFNPEVEELLLACLGAIHNLSFYQDAIDDPSASTTIAKLNSFHAGSMIERTADISATLCITYHSGPESVRSEIARVLGNLTRSSAARIAVHSAGGLKLLLKNLSSNDFDVIGTTCGVLVNMLSDWERRAPFRELNGPFLLRDVLQRGALNQDWLLALIACQALWNYLIDTGNVIGALGEDEADYISGDLLEYLDEERLFNGAQPDATWEQFAIVAADLLERIQSSISYNNSPYASSEEEEIEGRQTDDTTKISKSRFKMWLAESKN